MADVSKPLLDAWRQGDLALTPLELPIVILEDGEEVWAAMDAPHGVMLLTQSCDVIRQVETRPNVTVAVLVPASEEELARAKRLEVPSRVWIPALDNSGLLVDLDATATVHKSVVATWPRTPGCADDSARKALSRALARHRQRFAFPDEFNELIMPVRRWIESKRSKASHQGEFVRAMTEVRVQCDNWDAPTELTYLVIVDHRPDDDATMANWEESAKVLQAKVADNGNFPDGEFRIVTVDEVSAREYLESDRLDWDGLSDAA